MSNPVVLPQRFPSAGNLPNPMMTEEEFTRTVIELAKWHGWHVAHFRPARTSKGWRTPMQGDPGFPDLVLARGGVVILAELKSQTGRLANAQVGWRNEIGAAHRLWRPSDLPEILATLKRTR